MSNFLHSNDEYSNFMASMRQTVSMDLASKSKSQDLSQNLLNWMTWASFVDEGTVTQRWQLTGDPKVANSRDNYIGTISNADNDCHEPSTVTYDRSTGRFKLTFSYKAYNTDSSCKGILNPIDMGYDKIANGDNLSLNWDGVSLTLARAVNKGVSNSLFSLTTSDFIRLSV